MNKVTTPLIIGNWKMNPGTKTLAARLVTDIKTGLARRRSAEVVVAPPFVFLDEANRVHNGSRQFSLGAQNVHFEGLGARTGEISLPMLKQFGVTHVIVGHSERRAMGEKDEDINKKVHAVLKGGLTAVLCVGEKKRDHGGQYFGVVEEQVRSATAGISRAKLDRLVIAYEPVWAIGTGNNATPEDAHEMKLFIQKTLTDIYSRNYASKMKILYGGSVNGKNARDLMEHGMVDGFLVGGASLKAEEFLTIISESTT